MDQIGNSKKEKVKNNKDKLSITALDKVRCRKTDSQIVGYKSTETWTSWEQQKENRKNNKDKLSINQQQRERERE